MNWQHKTLLLLLSLSFFLSPIACGGEAEKVEDAEKVEEPASEDTETQDTTKKEFLDQKRKEARERRAAKKRWQKSAAFALERDLAGSNKRTRLDAAYRIREAAGSDPDFKGRAGVLAGLALKRPDITTGIVIGLLTMGEEGIEEAKLLTQSDDLAVRQAALAVFFQKPALALELYRSILKKNNSHDARYVAGLLVEMGPAAAPAVSELRKWVAKWISGNDTPYILALRAIGPAAKAAVPELLKVLKKEGRDLEGHYATDPPDYRGIFRSDTADALVHIGEASVPGLKAMLVDEKGKQRLTAAMILAALGPKADAAFSDLKEIATRKPDRGKNFSNSFKVLQAACVAALGRFGAKGGQELASILSGQKAHLVSEQLAHGLTEGIRNSGENLKPYRKALYRYLNVPKEYPHELNPSIVDALHAMGPEIVSELFGHLDEKESPSLRVNCAAALGKFGTDANSGVRKLRLYMRQVSEHRGAPGAYNALYTLISSVARVAPDSQKVMGDLIAVFIRSGGTNNLTNDMKVRNLVLQNLTGMQPANSKNLKLMIKQFENIRDQKRTVIDANDRYLLVRALTAMGGTTGEVIKILKAEAYESGTPQARYEATVAQLRQGIWVPSAIRLVRELAAVQDIGPLCDAIEKAPEAHEQGEVLREEVKRIVPSQWGRAALTLARLDLKLINSRMLRDAGKHLAKRPKALASDAAIAEYKANAGWIMEMLLLVAEPKRNTYTKSIVLLLDDPKLQDKAFGVLNIFAPSDPQSIRILQELRGQALDPDLEAKFTRLLEKLERLKGS